MGQGKGALHVDGCMTVRELQRALARHDPDAVIIVAVMPADLYYKPAATVAPALYVPAVVPARAIAPDRIPARHGDAIPLVDGKPDRDFWRGKVPARAVPAVVINPWC